MSWAGGRYLLAEVGSCQLEFSYLSDLLNDDKYKTKVRQNFQLKYVYYTFLG